MACTVFGLSILGISRFIEGWELRFRLTGWLVALFGTSIPARIGLIKPMWNARMPFEWL